MNRCYVGLRMSSKIIAWKRGMLYTECRRKIDSTEDIVLADELVVLDADSHLWRAARPLLDAALRLDQHNDTYSWHGWDKQQMSRFLKNLPSPCSLTVGVWETISTEDGAAEREGLALGIVCGVVEGEISSICTFEDLASAGLKPIKELDPGFDDVIVIMCEDRRLLDAMG